jgi:hypothetical protein
LLFFIVNAKIKFHCKKKKYLFIFQFNIMLEKHFAFIIFVIIQTIKCNQSAKFASSIVYLEIDIFSI